MQHAAAGVRSRGGRLTAATLRFNPGRALGDGRPAAAEFAAIHRTLDRTTAVEAAPQTVHVVCICGARLPFTRPAGACRTCTCGARVRIRGPGGTSDRSGI
ncbi:hypothetical protein SSCG_05254 [Streptomyces clavuligerus]|nr:hypothetical protein SSCG_05254 [Streptomyces clavuligerus]